MPKKFGDLTKSLNDLFKDDFGTDTSIKHKAKSANGVNIEISGKVKGDKTEGKLETSTSAWGLDFKETWSLDNLITFEVAKKNFADLKSKAVSEFKISPTDGLKETTIKANAEVGAVHGDIKLSGANVPSKVDVGVVYGHKTPAGASISVGAKISTSDILASAPSFDKTIATMYEPSGNQFVHVSYAIDKDVLEGSVYNVGGDFTVGGKATVKKGVASLEAVGLYKMDSTTTVKAKLNSDQRLDMAVIHKLGVATVAPSVVFDGSKPGIGLSLTLEP